MTIAVDTPFELAAGTPATLTGLTTVIIANQSGYTIFLGPVGTTTAANGLPIGPNEKLQLTFPTATSADLLSTVTLPAGIVRVTRLS